MTQRIVCANVIGNPELLSQVSKLFVFLLPPLVSPLQPPVIHGANNRRAVLNAILNWRKLHCAAFLFALDLFEQFLQVVDL